MVCFGFLTSTSIVWYGLFGASLRLTPSLVWSVVVSVRVIRVGEACPKCRGLHRSSIFSIPDLLNTVYITLKSLTREIYVSPFA
jgi:hypothetical protein